MQCPFNAFGCTLIGEERDIKQHLSDDKLVLQANVSLADMLWFRALHIAKLRDVLSPMKAEIIGLADGFEAPNRKLDYLGTYADAVCRRYGHANH